ncbi:MAG: TRAP transporter substrate-binding protein DctP [Myxococcota bacterium]
MNRRTLLTAAAVGLTACGGTATSDAGPAVHTRKRRRWSLASSFPRSLDTIFGAAEVFAERVAQMTDGRFEIRVYSAGELVPALEVLDNVGTGAVQLGQTGSYYYVGKNPALAFDTCVPFGLTARQQNAWLLEAGGLDLVNARLADFGVRAFPSGNTGVQMGGWFNRKVATLDDLKGLKMRIPGLGGAVMERLGVAPQTIAGGEIYTALERGAVDATDWVGPYDDLKLGFHQVVKHYHYPGWWEPGPNLSIYVNQGRYDGLTADEKAILAVAAHEAGLAMQTRYDQKNPAALAEIAAAGVEIAPFSDELLEEARKQSQAMLEEQAAADPAYREIYDHWLAFKNASDRWFGVAELAYAKVAFGR